MAYNSGIDINLSVISSTKVLLSVEVQTIPGLPSDGVEGCVVHAETAIPLINRYDQDISSSQSTHETELRIR